MPIYGRKADVFRILFRNPLIEKTMRPPIVNLPVPAEKIDGQTVMFRPMRDGIDSEVSGVIQVI